MIDPATLEKIAYRLKHAAGLYMDLRWTDLGSPAATECLKYADLLLDYARSSNDDNPKSITDAYDPAKVAETWTDFEPVYATLHFYYNDPDSMRRFRLCNQAEDLKLAMFEFDWWLRNRIKYNDSAIDEQRISEDGIEWLQIARDQLWKRCADYGIDLTED
jgi:hypothetical protein